MRVYIYTQLLTDFSRVWQNLAELGRSQLSQWNLVEFSQASILLEYLYWQNLIKLVELGRTYLLSVSLRYFYCNWVSPVIYLFNYIIRE